MEALTLRIFAVALGVWATAVLSPAGLAATYQTRNFSVTADQADVAEQVGDAAENYRRQLAIFWLGQPLPNWSKPCRLRVREGSFGASGQTTFQFVRGEVLNWDMSVQGTLERILDSVLPHEMNHTIFACHFRRPLPRWADEGAATLFEHRSEQLKQLALLNNVISNERERFSLKHLLSMKEYPDGMRPMLILYAQGYALADFLVQQKGRHAYLKFLSDGEKLGWDRAIQENFDHGGVESLEKNWTGWVLAGMPRLTLPAQQMVADTTEYQSAARAPLPQSGALPTAPEEMNAMGGFRSSGHRSGENAPPRPLIRSQSPEAPERTEFASPTPSTPAVNNAAGTVNAPFPQVPRQRPEGHTSVQSQPHVLQPVFEQGPHPQIGLSREFTSQRSVDEHRSGILTSFESVHLPGERNVVTGDAPAWAGFPGRKKLF